MMMMIVAVIPVMVVVVLFFHRYGILLPGLQRLVSQQEFTERFFEWFYFSGHQGAALYLYGSDAATQRFFYLAGLLGKFFYLGMDGIRLLVSLTGLLQQRLLFLFGFARAPRPYEGKQGEEQ